MSKYTLDYLRNHTLVGDIAVNGLPWTARALNVTANDKRADGRKWLWDGAIPVARVREHLDGFAVTAYPLVWARPATDADSGENVIVFDGEPFVLVTDLKRQVVADSATDRVHFTPKSGYVVHPFTETLVERTARIVGESMGDLHIDSVGVLADGGEAWVSIATGSLLTLPEGVDYYPHVLASSSHTGTLATSLQAVITMTVCDNTRLAALGEGKANGTVTKARHSSKSAQRLTDDESEARTALGLMDSANAEFAAQVKNLCETTVTDDQWSAFLDALAPVTEDSKPIAVTKAEKFRDEVSVLYRNDARNIWQGTAFGALQAVNTFDLWERAAYAGTDQYARIMRETITGDGDKREGERRAALVKVLAQA